MANRLKEDERNEKIIRGLLKLPANRRCINCNNLGPQYVCSNFLTFICTACSGIHREFSHRVKSISMATFTSQEVSALQEGGNEHAKGIYFKEWDPQRHSFPDTSNVDKLRNFIKHVYVDRRFSGERSTHDLQRYAREDCNDSRREESHRGASRSPSNDEHFCERFNSGGRDDVKSFRYAFGERSPGYDNVENKRDARRFIVVDDRRRDIKFGNQRFENRRSLDEALKAERPPPNHRREVGVTNLPTVRAIKDFFGDEPPLCVDDTSKSNNLRSPGYHAPKSNEARVLVSDTSKSNDTRLSVGKTPKSNDVGVFHNSQQTERLSGSRLGSCCENNLQSRTANTGSLIDFSTELEASAVPAMPQIVTKQTISSPAQEGDGASFDFMNQQKGHPTAANSTNLEAELAELSTRTHAFPGNMAILPICGNNSSPKANDAGITSDIQKIQNSPSHSLFPTSRAQSAGQPSVESPAEAANDLSWESALASSTQVSLTAPPPQHPSQAASEIPLETNAGTLSQSHPSEVKSSGRKELPEDLFTALYQSPPAPPVGWQRAPYPCMGYGIHYNLARPAFPNLTKPMNPFDLNSEPALSHASSFPSMASLEEVLPNMSGPALLRSSSFGSHSPAYTHQQQPTYPTTLSPSTYVAQSVPTNMPVPSKIVTMTDKKIVYPEGEATLSSTPRLGQYSAATYCHPSMQNSFTPGGNPFV